MYVSVHNWTCSPGPDDQSLIDIGRGYHLQSSELRTRPHTDLTIRYSSLSPNCPTRSHIKPFHQLIIFSNIPLMNQGIKALILWVEPATCKEKTLKGWGVCNGACHFIGTMLDFLSFTNVDPQKFGSNLLVWRHNQNLSHNEMHDLNN
jgi:hypothetical protein